MSVSVNLRLAEGLVKLIDDKVNIGLYKSRAQFCEIAIHHYIEELGFINEVNQK